MLVDTNYCTRCLGIRKEVRSVAKKDKKDKGEEEEEV